MPRARRCDRRCWQAIGTRCHCLCGGARHGSVPRAVERQLVLFDDGRTDGDAGPVLDCSTSLDFVAITGGG